MLKRTITGFFIVAAIYIMIYFSYTPYVTLFAAAILSGFSVYEICRATETIENEGFFTFSMLISIGLVFCNIPFYKELVRVVFVLAVIVFALMMIRIKHIKLSFPVQAVILELIIIIMFKAMPQLIQLENGIYYLTFAVTLCFVTDVAAYLVGRSCGRHKLIPKISPNKTVEGAVAGVVFAVLFMNFAGFLLEYFSGLSIDHILLTVYSLCTSLVAQFGDLSMSAVKRSCGIKDFGNILPGHGGILDRFDSHLFSISFTFLYCVYTEGFIK